MSGNHSFYITLSNNRTEKEAVEYLRLQDTRVRVLDTLGRETILEHLQLPRHLGKAFDLIRIPADQTDRAAIDGSLIDDIELIEIKSTKKLLRRIPYGFFFGATANEFELAERLGDRFKFCFVCLHPASEGHCYFSNRDLEPLIRSKRIQYQINLHSQPKHK